MRLHAALVFFLALALVLAACSSSSSSGASTGQDAGMLPGSDAPDTDTWDNWGLAFFTKYCIECHAANNPDGLDFGQKSIVVTNKDTIRCGVCVQQQASWSCPAAPVAEQFPISDSAGTNPKPTNDERDRVVAWIDAGCP
jgi:hypothetical protein